MRGLSFEKELLFSNIFLITLMSMLPLAAIFPRFMALGPGLVGVISCGFYRPVFGCWPRFSKPFFLCVFALLFLAGVSSFWAIDASQSLGKTLKLGVILLSGGLLFSVSISLRRESLSVFLRFFPFFLLSAALINLLDLYFNGPVYNFVRGSVRTEPFNESEINRNIVCAILPVFIGLAVIYVSDYPLKTKIFLKTITALAVFSMLALTDSQSAQLSLFMGVAFLLFFPYRSKVAWYALGVVFCALLWSAPWLSQYLFRAAAPAIEDMAWFSAGYAPHRMEIWDFVSRYALQKPLYGHGIEATRMVEAFDTAQIYQKGVDILHPHNFAVQIWMEFGALGASAGTLFFSYIFYRIYKLPQNAARIILPTFIACISVAATGYGLWQSWWIGEFTLIASYAGLLGTLVSPPKSSL